MRTRIVTQTCAIGLVAAALSGCISSDSPLVDATEGCDPTQEVDASVKAFVEASAEFEGVASASHDAVLEACSGIATDLGEEDTWSDLDGSAKISNGDGTGACDVAARRVEAIMTADASANANFALVITRGVCHLDFEAQARCDAECTADKSCDPGSIETRCEPGELSVQCQASCDAEATCEGTMDRPANCMGMCESECQGDCRGACIAEDGSRTDGNPNCRGKCSSSCNGTCRGLCKEEQPVECGAEVRCKAGCTGEFTAPECETQFTPPSCTVDVACHESCSAQVEANAICDPPSVRLFADVSVSADVELLVQTIDAHLPHLLAAADAEGRLAVDAVGHLTASARAVAESTLDLDGNSIACVGDATQSSASAAVSLNASFSGSVEVFETCSAHSS